MLLSADEVDEFAEVGFLPARPLLSEDEAESLRLRMMDVAAGQSSGEAESVRNLTGDDANVVVQIVNIWAADDAFHAHIYNPLVCAAVAELTASPVLRVWHDQVQYKPPRVGGPTDWHQDHPYWPIIQPADLVSAWVALDDADIDNGCMWMVPGSHRWGAYHGGTIGTDRATYQPAPDPADVPVRPVPDAVPCPARKGEVMFHHCLTWHGARPNRTDRGRPAIAVHYMPGHTRYVPSGSHLVEHNITVEPGEVLQGEHFPTVWNRGPVEVPVHRPQPAGTPT